MCAPPPLSIAGVCAHLPPHSNTRSLGSSLGPRSPRAFARSHDIARLQHHRVTVDDPRRYTQLRSMNGTQLLVGDAYNLCFKAFFHAPFATMAVNFWTELRFDRSETTNRRPSVLAFAGIASHTTLLPWDFSGCVPETVVWNRMGIECSRETRKL